MLLRWHPGDRRRVRASRPRHDGSSADEVILCRWAQSTGRNCYSSPVSARPPTWPRWGSRWFTTCQASASTCRTIWRSTSSTLASRSRCSRTRRSGGDRSSVCNGCSCNGPGATNHFEAGGFVRWNDDVAYPNLMFHFLPIAVRYDGSARPAGHGYQVHVGPMYSDARGAVGSSRPIRECIRRCVSTTSRPIRIGASGSRQFELTQDPQSASDGRLFNGGETLAGPDVSPTNRSSTGCAATVRPRCIRRAHVAWVPPTTTASSIR